MSKLGVAVLGLDHWYAAFDVAAAIARSEQVQLVAVSHDNEHQAREIAQKNGCDFATSDYRAALDRADVQIVACFYSTDRNVTIAREAAGLGKHIMSVKPMALDLAGADAIVEAVRAAGVQFFPMESLRRVSAEGQRLKAWIDQGRIGTPLRYTQTLNGSLPMAWPGSSDTGWWTDPARVPGGAWIDHAIYAIDLARWVLGAEVASVCGVADNRRYPDLKLEDYGLATFTLTNGAVASIEDTWTADRGYGFSRSEFIGTRGAILDDTAAWGKLALRGDFGFDGWVAVERAPAGEAVVDHVAAVVRGEREPLATVADGRANLAACLAFYEAARNGTTVRL